jgi:tryptophan synthase alpha chain
VSDQAAREVTGLARIAGAFATCRGQGRAALMPYVTLGYPSTKASLAVVEAIAPFSDLLELGVPFSDPIADGPAIQFSTQTALENGMTTAGCLAIVRELRGRGVQTPALLMGYANPILAYGEAALVRDAAAAGVDGLIVPDLPLEESAALRAQATAAGIGLISFLAPTSSEERIHRTAAAAQGFIYLVSVTGVTGARASLRADLASFVARIRELTDVPVAVGFGISTPQQAAEVSVFADGVIVGSALVEIIGGAESGTMAAAAFVRQLREAMAGRPGRD